MSDINKRILENAAELASLKAGQCGESLCGGGHIPSMPDGDPVPCPTCAKLRKVAGQCWHEAEYPHFIAGHFNQPCGVASKEASCKNGCGLKWDNGLKIGGTGGRSLEATFRNPTYTVQTIRKLLEDIGEWEGFKDDLFASLLQEILGTIDYRVAEAMKKFADILTSDDLMRQAVDSYLEHRVGEVA